METIIRKCPVCGASTVLEVPAEELAAYEAGALVQDAFPDLSITERETIITGMCRSCQKKFFGK